jgi:amino acid transporter
VYSLFDYGLATGGPAFFRTIPIVMLGQLFVLLTFAEIASQYPIAGGVYQWAKRLVGPKYAWFSGWMYTWALLVTIASIAFPVSTYVGPLLGYTPAGSPPARSPSAAAAGP